MQRIIIDRFWARVEKKGADECWPWTGGGLPAGYGVLVIPTGKRGGKKLYAHRVSFEIANGGIDPDLLVCHSCDNPPCCNPKHLWQGTDLDNALDKIAKGRARSHYGPNLKIVGEGHGMAKLDADKVRLIRRLRADGLLLEDIGAQVGVGKSTVSRVINRDKIGGWTHV
jgi:hypothetical protein